MKVMAKLMLIAMGVFVIGASMGAHANHLNLVFVKGRTLELGGMFDETDTDLKEALSQVVINGSGDHINFHYRLQLNEVLQDTDLAVRLLNSGLQVVVMDDLSNLDLEIRERNATTGQKELYRDGYFLQDDQTLYCEYTAEIGALVSKLEEIL